MFKIISRETLGTKIHFWLAHWEWAVKLDKFGIIVYGGSGVGIAPIVLIARAPRQAVIGLSPVCPQLRYFVSCA